MTKQEKTFAQASKTTMTTKRKKQRCSEWRKNYNERISNNNEKK
jgi:hypothetical protein